MESWHQRLSGLPQKFNDAGEWVSNIVHVDRGADCDFGHPPRAFIDRQHGVMRKQPRDKHSPAIFAADYSPFTRSIIKRPSALVDACIIEL